MFMKLQNSFGNTQVHLRRTELNSQQDTTVNHHSKDQGTIPKKTEESESSINLSQGNFNALLAMEEFNINNVSPKEFTNLIKDITHLSSATGEADDDMVDGLRSFRVSLEVRMSTGQLDPNAKIDMQKYVNDYIELSESLSKQDRNTYSHSPMYANQSKQAIDTYFTQSNLEKLQLKAIDFLKKSDSNLIDKKV